MSATDPVKRDRVDPAREVVGARRTAQRFLESVLDGVIDTLVRPGGGDEGSDERGSQPLVLVRPVAAVELSSRYSWVQAGKMMLHPP